MDNLDCKWNFHEIIVAAGGYFVADFQVVAGTALLLFR